MKVDKKQLEKHRRTWAKVARKRGWYTRPFFIQVWVDKAGNILDSVSFRGLARDIVERG